MERANVIVVGGGIVGCAIAAEVALHTKDVFVLEELPRYNTSRPHQSLDRNSPMPRVVQAVGEVCANPVLGGLHHRYDRAA